MGVHSPYQGLALAGALAIFALVLRAGWELLPLETRYWEEITVGNRIAAVLEANYRSTGIYPLDTEWDDWQKVVEEASLEFNWKYEIFYPTYHTLEGKGFRLSFIQGFDGPYLSWDTEGRTWVLE